MFTDYLDQQIHDGDEIVYAQSAYGGGAVLHRAFIHKIVPLVQHRESASSFMRADQAGQANPTRFNHARYEDPAKRFVIQIMREKTRFMRDGNTEYKKYTIPHSNHIIRVPDAS